VGGLQSCIPGALREHCDWPATGLINVKCKYRVTVYAKARAQNNVFSAGVIELLRRGRPNALDYNGGVP
jgi:hypothetical protein